MLVKFRIPLLIICTNFLTINAIHVKIEERILDTDSIKRYKGDRNYYYVIIILLLQNLCLAYYCFLIILTSSKIFSVNSVEELDLKDNLIEHIRDGTFDEFLNLRELDLSYNSISLNNLFSFGSHPGLEYLNLGHNRGLKSMSSETTISMTNRYPDLKTLYLNDLGARNISSRNWRDLMPRLKFLDLSGNRGLEAKHLLRNFPPSIEYLSLKSCSLSHVKVKELHHLKTLHLRGNIFRSLRFTDRPNTCESGHQVCLGPMNNLENLLLDRNNISEFTIQFFTKSVLPKLKYLNLTYNNLKTINLIPVSFVFPKLLSVNTLELDGNYLDSLAVTCAFTNLKYLYASKMKGDSNFELNQNSDPNCLPNVRECYLVSNNLHEIPDEFLEKMHKLEVLDLSFNRLTKFPVLSHNLLLKVLRLKMNNIQCDATCSDGIKLDSLKKLECLDIRKNNIGPRGINYLKPVLNVTSKTYSTCFIKNKRPTIPG